MTHVEFFPYRVCRGALHLSLSCAHDLAEVQGDRLAVLGVPDGDSLPIQVTVKMDTGVLEEVLPEAEREDPPVELVIAVRSLSARLRRPIILEDSGHGVWSAEVNWPKAELYGAIDLVPALVRTSAGGEDGLAKHKGALLATGSPARLEIDEAPVPPGDYLDIKFEDFRASGNKQRKRNADLLYSLDTEHATPLLRLNEAVDSLKEVMLAKGPRGRTVRVRNAMFDTIVSQVWTSLLAGVVAKLTFQLGQGEEADPVEELTEWETRVVNFWAPLLYAEAGDRAEALQLLVDDAKNIESINEIFDRMSFAIQRQARTPDAFAGLIRLRDNDNV